MNYRFYYIPPFKEKAPQIYTYLKMDDIQQLWTLSRETDENKSPTMPLNLKHHKTAYLEDPVHDYSVRDGKLRYASRYSEGGHWIIIILDTSCPSCKKTMKILDKYCPLCGLPLKY